MSAVLIVDASAIAREGLKQIIVKGIPGTVVVEAHNALDTLSKLRKRSWNLVIIDLMISDRSSGLEFLSEIHHAYPELPVLVLSSHTDEEHGVRALKAGAAGYLHKSVGREELVRAVRYMLSGRKYISANLASIIATTRAGRPRHHALSNREYEIMQGIALGRTLTEIAQSLSISIKTVSTHKRRLLRKMRMETNADLTKYVIEHRLIGLLDRESLQDQHLNR